MIRWERSLATTIRLNIIVVKLVIQDETVVSKKGPRVEDRVDITRIFFCAGTGKRSIVHGRVFRKKPRRIVASWLTDRRILKVIRSHMRAK